MCCSPTTWCVPELLLPPCHGAVEAPRCKPESCLQHHLVLFKALAVTSYCLLHPCHVLFVCRILCTPCCQLHYSRLKQRASCAQVFSFTAPLARSAAEPKAAPARGAVPTPWYDPAAAHAFLVAHGLAVRAVGAPQTCLRLA